VSWSAHGSTGGIDAQSYGSTAVGSCSSEGGSGEAAAVFSRASRAARRELRDLLGAACGTAADPLQRAGASAVEGSPAAARVSSGCPAAGFSSPGCWSAIRRSP
jgi:hypothetical protein